MELCDNKTGKQFYNKYIPYTIYTVLKTPGSLVFPVKNIYNTIAAHIRKKFAIIQIAKRNLDTNKYFVRLFFVPWNIFRMKDGYVLKHGEFCENFNRAKK